MKLQPTSEQAEALRETLERANAAANCASTWTWEHSVFRYFELRKALYYDIRAEFGLSAQVTILLLGKVADAYKLDKNTQRIFRPTGSITYDDRILSWNLTASTVSIWTVAGRQTMPFVCGERQRRLLTTRQGETDLAIRDGTWFLFATCNVEEPEPGDVSGYLGVDLGIVNIATDSDGTIHAGALLNGLRHRHRRLRRKLQARGTKSARRLLKKRSRKEARFGRHTNHCISKEIVAKAECTARGIALEDLKGIRQRTRARRPQRAMLSSWAFAQLGGFIAYKAQREGTPVVWVDPRNTSRECPACGHVDKRNRASQSCFSCIRCGFAGPADAIAAGTIARRAALTRPHVSDGSTPLPAPGTKPHTL